MRKMLVIVSILLAFTLSACDVELDDSSTAPKVSQEESTQSTQPSAPKHQILISAGLTYDSLFEKNILYFDATIKNNDTKNYKPYYDFKLYSPSGSTISQTYVYQGNDNACTFFDAEIRPGGQMTCRVAFEVTQEGNYDLELYDSVFSSKPIGTLKYQIVNGILSDRD